MALRVVHDRARGPSRLPSVALHELGHAFGMLYHLDYYGDSYGACAATSTHHTMCTNLISRGSSLDRTLEEHDRHTFDNAY